MKYPSNSYVMIKLIATTIFTLTLTSGVGQSADNTNRQSERNIYLQALIQCIKFRDEDSLCGKPEPIDTFFILDDINITDSLLENLGL